MKKKKVSRTQTGKRPAKRALPRPRAAPAARASSGDTTLLVAGLALVVLVLGETVFMTFSVRYLRGAG